MRTHHLHKVSICLYVGITVNTHINMYIHIATSFKKEQKENKDDQIT